MLFALFFLLLFSPCLVAYAGGELAEHSLLNEWQGCQWALPARKRSIVKQPALRLEETELSEGFVLRSFPKGIAQRRVVIQDAVDGIRMTITAVRVAVKLAAETVRAACQTIRETRVQLLERLAAEARIAIAQGVVREGRMSRRLGAEYAQACARLRWSEISTDAGWSQTAEQIAA